MTTSLAGGFEQDSTATPASDTQGTAAGVCHFSIADDDDDVELCTAEPEEQVWAREKQELEKSKVQFQQTIRRQQEVEQSVSSLLSRLAELPASRPQSRAVSPVRSQAEWESSSSAVAAATVATPSSSSEAKVREANSGDSAATPVAPSVSPLEVAASDSTPVGASDASAQSNPSIPVAPAVADTSSRAALPSESTAVASVSSASIDKPASEEGPSSPAANPQARAAMTPPSPSSPDDAARRELTRKDSARRPTVGEPLGSVSPSRPRAKGSSQVSPIQMSPLQLSPPPAGSTSAQQTLVSPRASSSSARIHSARERRDDADAGHDADAEYADEILTAEAGPASARGCPPPLPDLPALPTASVASSAPAVSSTAYANPVADTLPVLQPFSRGAAVGDQSLLPRRSSNAGTDADLWCGWTIETSQDGRLFYYHTSSELSQWEMPNDLIPVLGQWELIPETHSDPASSSGPYWRNEVLGVSLWKDPRHTTNLFQAALDGNLFFLQLYAEVGGFLDAVDAKGRTALHYNCAGGEAQAVMYLLQNGANADATDQGGSTPLHWACRYGHDTIVRILLDAKANPNCQNHLGDTAMHEAAALGRIASLDWLVLAGADATLRNRELRTAAEVAQKSRSQESVELLQLHERRQLRRWRSADPEAQSDEDSDDLQEPQPRRSMHTSSAPANTVSLPGAGRAEEQRGPQAQSDSGTESETDEPDPSLALVIVRAARPLLRGAQWLANRVLGEKKASLGEKNNRYSYDAGSRQWVMQRPEVSARQHWEAEARGDSDESEESCYEEEEERVAPLRPPPPRKPRMRAPSSDSEGMP